MNLIEIAQIYTDLVKIEKNIPSEEFHAKDLINVLRTKYHELLMQKMREDHFEFCDRFDAANKAFEIVHSEKNNAKTI